MTTFLKLELCNQWGRGFLAVKGTNGAKELRFAPPDRRGRLDVLERNCDQDITVRWPDGTVMQVRPFVRVEQGEAYDHGKREVHLWERYFVPVRYCGAEVSLPLEQLEVAEEDVRWAEVWRRSANGAPAIDCRFPWGGGP